MSGKKSQRGVPDDVLAKLKNLKDRKFDNYDSFLSELKQQLDAE